MNSGYKAAIQRVTGLLLVVSVLAASAWPEGRTTAADQNPAPGTRLLLKEGTEINLKLRDKLSSKTAVGGDSVNLILDQDLKVGEITVAKSGSAAVGMISHTSKAGMLGRPGEISLRLEYLKVGDTRVKLRGSKGKEGTGKEGAAVAFTILFGPIGLIKHGRNAELKAGTPLVAYADQDTELASVQ